MIYPFVSSLCGDEFVIVLYAWFLRIIRAICALTRYRYCRILRSTERVRGRSPISPECHNGPCMHVDIMHACTRLLRGRRCITPRLAGAAGHKQQHTT